MAKRRRRKSTVPNNPPITKTEKESLQMPVPRPEAKELMDWEARVRKEGVLQAEELRKEGSKFVPMLLAPRVVRGGDEVPLAGVIAKPDSKVVAKRELTNLATELISKAYLMDMLDNSLPAILRAVIEERGIYEYSVGELFTLYGIFQQKYGVFDDKAIRKKMSCLLDGDESYLREYVDRGKPQKYPLPYVVRTVLAHPKNKNVTTLESLEQDIEASVQLLRRWVKDPDG